MEATLELLDAKIREWLHIHKLAVLEETGIVHLEHLLEIFLPEINVCARVEKVDHVKGWAPLTDHLEVNQSDLKRFLCLFVVAEE
jgi:hypothetical protein